MKPQLTHHKPFALIGFSEVFACNEGYEKCPQFWDEAYSARFSRLFKTMKAENPTEQAILDNRIGEYAVCHALEGDSSFEYMICGEYKGGHIPEDMKLATVPESDWLEFRNRGPLPKALQEQSTFVHQVWMKDHADEFQSLGFDIEWYSDGNPMSDDYEFGIFIPVICKKPMNSDLCFLKNECVGCSTTNASCVSNEGSKNKCTTLESQLIDEFNALQIPDMPKVTELHSLDGSFINMEYLLPNGCKFKLWRDDHVYLGNQLEKTDGSGRCYGLTADETHLLVCEYGCDGANPEIVIYKRR